MGSCSCETVFALLNQFLDGIEHIFFDNGRMGTLSIEAIFLAPICMLIEGNCRFTVGFLIEAIANIPLIF